VLALVTALFLSGRFVADIERIRSAVVAFAAGDWRRLEKSSRDELGGALVDSINDMATAVAERMRRDEADSWRSLVRVVSHEINNTLAPIRSVAASLRAGLDKRLRDGDAGADADMALKLIVERVDALATFIDGYAEVAKLPEPTRRASDVERLVAGAAGLFAEEAERRGVTLDVRAAGVGIVDLDAQQIERVLVNLIKNALEASPRGAAVEVMAARVAAGVELIVADAGPGISAEARRNLFVPYFTTKPGGSGIGLALARQIVVAHGGTITAEHSLSGGTLMRVVLPQVARPHPYREVA
jgi:signal transduction histidine kinase